MPRDVELSIAHKELRKIVARAIENGDLHLKLNVGGDGKPEAVAFTLDKKKYRLRLTDETEESVKVWIEPIAQ